MRQVLGQTRAIETLQAGLTTRRLHHAYIFHGPGGVGKFTTALAFAQTLLCPDAAATPTGEIEACGVCRSCRMFDARDAGDRDAVPQAAHPDLHVVTKELARFDDSKTIRDRKLTKIPVQVLRSALLDPVTRRSQMSGGACDKVFVVDEAELLNSEGQNLLLKTLEEPPPRTVLILVTSSEDRLLPTIRSRCQRVSFVPLADPVVAQWIEDHLSADDKAAMTARERQWLVSFAGGSLGRARLALDYGLVGWARAVLPVVNGLGARRAGGAAELGAQIAGMIDGFAAEWVKRHANASKEAANKLAAGLMGAMIATYARDKVAEAAGGCDPADPAAAEAALEPWLGVIDAVDRAGRLLQSNVNMGLVCDHLVGGVARSLGGAAAAA